MLGCAVIMDDMRGNSSGKHRPKSRHHGYGTIVKRADHWRAEPWIWQLRSTDPDSGRRVLVASCSGGSKAECERRAKTELDRIARATSLDALSLTVADYLDRWIATKLATVRKPRTFERYQSTVNRLRPAFADVTLAALDQAGVERRLTGTPNQRAYGLLVLRMALKEAVGTLIVANPTSGVRAPTVIVREAPTVDVETARAILAACETDPWGPFVILALTTGLRRGELLALRRSDYVAVPPALRVEHNLQRLPPEFREDADQTTRPEAPKSRKSRRIVPLGPTAVAAVKLQLENVKETRRAARVWAENDLLFCNDHGEAWHPNTATRNSEALIRRVVPGARLHDMRAAWETLLASEGAGEHIRMGLAGHASVKQTLDYTKVIPADARRATMAVDRRLAKAR